MLLEIATSSDRWSKSHDLISGDHIIGMPSNVTVYLALHEVHDRELSQMVFQSASTLALTVDVSLPAADARKDW